MWMIMLPIAFLIILLLFFVLFLIFFKRQEKTLKTMDEKGKIKQDNTSSNATKVTDNSDKKSQYKKEDVFKFMEFDSILNNMIVQNGGSRFSMAIKCKGINYDLMSEVEQLSVEEGFITFLNTLRYPIQLYVQAQNVDLKSVIESYRKQITPISQEYDDINKQYTKLASNFDVDESQLNKLSKERDSITNVYEYAQDMINYVEKMNLNKNLLQRNFYIIISYSTAEIPAVDKFNKDEIVEMCFTELTTRCQAIISALSSCSVSGVILDSNELADLLYSAFNRDDRGLMNVQDALDSGVFRLYSTSEDAVYKKTMALEDYLKSEAKIKALEAMKAVLEGGKIETAASRVIDEEEEISKRATTMVKAIDIDPELKDQASKRILNDFRETKQAMLEEDKRLKEEYVENANEELKQLDELKNRPKPEGIKLIEKAKEMERNAPSTEKRLEDALSSNDETEVIQPVTQPVEEQVEQNGMNDENVLEQPQQTENPMPNVYESSENEEDESII